MNDKPGALRLAAMEGHKSSSPIRTISEQLDAALAGAHDPEDGVLSLPGVVSETGLELPPGLEFSKWQQVGFTLRRIRGAWEWWVGDWLNYGERVYGEMYSQAIEDTGLDYNRLSQVAYVARRITPEMRHKDLAWSSHEAVAPLEHGIAVSLLNTAEAEGWKRERVRAEAKALRSNVLPAVKLETICQCHCHSAQLNCACGQSAGPLN